MSDRKKIWQVACVYIGIVLGAGFASGQEVLQFFVRFGAIGFLGLCVSGVILAFCGFAVLDICQRQHIKSYEEFIDVVLGKQLGFFVGCSVFLFMLVLFCTMLAGVGALAVEAFHFPFTAGVVLFAIACFFVFLFDLKGVLEVNSILAPMMVVSGIFFGLFTLFTDYTSVFAPALSKVLDKSTDHFLVSAVVYAAYNIITAVCVLSGMHEMVTSRKIAKWGGLLGAYV